MEYEINASLKSLSDSVSEFRMILDQLNDGRESQVTKLQNDPLAAKLSWGESSKVLIPKEEIPFAIIKSIFLLKFKLAHQSFEYTGSHALTMEDVDEVLNCIKYLVEKLIDNDKKHQAEEAQKVQEATQQLNEIEKFVVDHTNALISLAKYQTPPASPTTRSPYLQKLVSNCADATKNLTEEFQKRNKIIQANQERLAYCERNLGQVTEVFAKNKVIMENTLQLSYPLNGMNWENPSAHYAAQINVLIETVQTLKANLSSEQRQREKCEKSLNVVTRMKLAEQKQREKCEENLNEVTKMKLETEAKLKNAIEARDAVFNKWLKIESINEKPRKKQDDEWERTTETVKMAWPGLFFKPGPQSKATDCNENAPEDQHRCPKGVKRSCEKDSPNTGISPSGRSTRLCTRRPK